MKNKKQYWKGLEELNREPEFEQHAHSEFPEYLPVNLNKREGGNDSGTSRRDFLKMMGFGISAATLAACEAPVRKAIPYLNKPVEIDPGVANFYASSYINGGDYASVVVKTREGRPIKIEGNKESSITMGGTSAQQQASVLSLYDQQRYDAPRIAGKKAEWQQLDEEVLGALKRIAAEGGRLAVVSKTVLSPSMRAAVAAFQAKNFNTDHIIYDAVSVSAIPAANEKSFGRAVIPSYDFSKADVIVSFDADFMNNWISPVQFSAQYAKTRKLIDGNKEMSRHYQFESNLSLTGGNADYRSPIKPSEQGLAVAQLYNELARLAGEQSLAAKTNIEHVSRAAKDLWLARGKSLVVSGSNDVNVQILVNAINSMLDNYGRTINLDVPLKTRQGDDKAMAGFAAGLKSGKYAGVIFLGANPVYDYVKGADIAKGIKKTKLTVSTSDRRDETSELVNYVAPDHHFLEQWNDAEPVEGFFSLAQPTISPIFNTRQAGESLLAWAENNISYYDFVKSCWKKNLFPMQSSQLLFDSFWDESLYSGVFEPGKGKTSAGKAVFAGDVNEAASGIAKTYKTTGEYEVALYAGFAVGDGSQANNPFLQELPDPISKVTWDNYAAVSVEDAHKFGFSMKEENTNMVNVTISGKTYELPVVIQPGQAKGTVGIALGYGRRSGGKVAEKVGLDLYPAVGSLEGYQNLSVTKGVKVEPSEKSCRIARTQTHQTVMGRTNVVQEATLSEYQKDPFAGREFPHISGMDGTLSPTTVSLWKGHKYEDHHWGLAIDLTACNGCSSCVVSCNVENNIPAVGKEEVMKRREMTWLRIDRYYSSDGKAGDFEAMEQAAANPEVTFMPMMCQQCNNAPCETVCPVAATTHSTEGLNQMTYNRCIGTRYCANNCPYKVRRFNWFKYFDNNDSFPDNLSQNNELGKMVLNPDVTVRSRGVMEKCSFCVQRIQAGKLEARKDGRKMNDGDVDVACAASCSAGALVFGDMNNPESRISKMLKLKKSDNVNVKVEAKEPRAYHSLEEINVQPNVYYLTKIRNKDSKGSNA
ncbi:MAG: TAT-variant-translocated molybdopterin oxidoreductase [Cytophagales bacterium]|nr:TAT-variant-translocated molybdopterin oxidoreductase [Cytophagales bacterium]